jgi:hypothetical protein
VAVIGVLVLAGSASAGGVGLHGGDDQIVLTGTLEIPAGTTVDRALIFDGDASIDGSVRGSVVALRGDVHVTGSVGGDAVALGGRVVLEPGAAVGGDVVSGDPAQISDRATVGGNVTRTSQGIGHLRGIGIGLSRAAFWVASSVSALALGILMLLLARRGTEAAARTASGSLGPAIGWGLLAFLGLPVVALIAGITIVGLPLALGLVLALALTYWVGWVVAALAVGRLIVKPPANVFGAFAVGWAILRVLALIPGVGAVMWFAASVWGLGGLAVATVRANREAPGAPTPSVPPMPPMPA